MGFISNELSVNISYNKIIISMHNKEATNFLYQQRNENFPQYRPSETHQSPNIGKMLAKYRRQPQIQSIGQKTLKNRQKDIGTQQSSNRQVSPITGINYSQLYNQLKIQKASQYGKKEKEVEKSNSSMFIDEDRDKAKQKQKIKEIEKFGNEEISEDIKISKGPFYFQSAIQIRNRKALPGVIVRSPRIKQTANGYADISFNSSRNQLISEHEEAQRKIKPNRQFRISQIRDKGEKRPNFHDISDLSINTFNDNSSHYQLQRMTQPERRVQEQAIIKVTGRTNTVNLNKYHQNIERRQAVVSQGQHQRSNQNSIQKQKSPRNVEQKQKNQQLSQKKISEQQVLGNSRSIGVGNHRIDKKDLQHVQHMDSEMNTPNIRSKKQSPRYNQHDIEQQIKVENAENRNKKKQVKKQMKDTSVDALDFNPENVSKQKIKDEKKQMSNKIDETFPIKSSQKKKMYGYQMVESVHIESQQVQTKSNKTKFVHFQNQTTGQSLLPVKKTAKQTITNRSQKPHVEHSSTPNLSIEVSRVASSIAPKVQHNQNEPQINFEPINDSQNDIKSILQHDPSHQTPHNPHNPKPFDQSQPQPTPQPHPQPPAQHPQPQLQKQDYIETFNIEQYNKIYEILKSIQNSLKASIVNVQQIMRAVKAYLEVIASGGLDNIDQFDLPLHRKKIIKNSLFFQRVSMVLLAFCYCGHTVKDNLKYLLNMVGYGLNNCLILAKVLEQTQITSTTQKSRPQNSLVQKSDRLLMKRNLDTLRNNNNVLMDVIQKLSKSDQMFHENLSQIIKLISKSSLQQTFYSLLEYFSFYLCNSGLDHMVPFLAVAPNPYLAPLANQSKYTLVIDVVEIFCYGTKKSKTNIFRPYTQHFLTQMSQYYEIISFTPMFPSQIDKIIDLLDPKGLIIHRLYKHHTINNNNQSLKYLDRIGRNVDQMILLDNQNVGGQAAYQNCLHVPMWKGSKNDTVLAELCPLLAMIALKKVKAGDAVKKVREQSMKNKKEGVKYINFGISLD